MKLKIHWNKNIERWVMTNGLGSNIMEFPDCANFRFLFRGISKEKENFVEINAKVEEENKTDEG